MNRALVLLALGFLATEVSGQRLRVVSEFQRYSPDGTVVAADRTEKPREIISPAVARNSHSTYRIIVKPGAAGPFNLFIAQNPDDVLKAKLYQERYVEEGGVLVPSGLNEVPLSLSSSLTQQKVQTYLLDLWIPEAVSPQRVRVEVQLNVGDEWTIYPLEVRVQQAVVPKLTQHWSTPRAYACPGTKSSPLPPNAEITQSRILARNLDQDLVLLSSLPEAKQPSIPLLAGFPDLSAFCKAPGSASPNGPEWWLKVRDRLIQSSADSSR